MGQAWDKELSAEHSKLFSDWCSELRETRAMSINRPYFENWCTNLRLHIFTDASEEAMFIVAYLKDEATTDICNREMSCGTHHTHDDTKVRTPSRSLRNSSQKADSNWAWCQNWQKIFHWTDSSTVLQWLQAAHKKQQVFAANRAAEILENSSMDQWRHVKGVENPADIGTRRMSIEGLRDSVWLNGPAWLQKDEDNWPKPWCQEKEIEAEQAISTVATETQVEQTFDWNRYSSFNKIKNFIAYCMRFKTKEKGPLKAEEIHQVEQILFRFVQNRKLPECFKVDSKQQRNLENNKHRQIVTLHRRRWNNSSERSTEAFKPPLQCQKTNTIDSKASSSTNSVGEHPSWQLARRNTIREKHAPTRILDHWTTKCITKNQVKMYQMQTLERQPNPPTDGGPAPRATWWACYPIHPYRSWLLRTHRNEVPTKYLEEMVLPLHVSNNKSSTHRSCTVIGHRVMSSCSDKIHRTTWLSKCHH